MKKITLFLALALAWSCGNSQYDGKTHFGYDFVYHKKGSGPVGDSGMVAYFLIDMKFEDTTDLVPRDPSNIEYAPIIAPSDNERKNAVLDALAMMKVGDSVTVYVPVDSMPPIGVDMSAHEMVLNHISLLELKTQEEYQNDQMAKQEETQRKMEANQALEAGVAELVQTTLTQYKDGKLENVKKLPSGLEIYTVEEGTGAPVKEGEYIETQYYGVLKEDGTMFDNSFKRGLPFPFGVGLGQVITGWDEGFQQLKRGDKALLFIPSEMGYGEQGGGAVIPPNADLVFYVEVGE